MEQAQDFAKDTYDQVGTYCPREISILNEESYRPLKSLPIPTTALLGKATQNREFSSPCGHNGTMIPTVLGVFRERILFIQDLKATE